MSQLQYCSKHNNGAGAYLPSDAFYASRPGRACCKACYKNKVTSYFRTEKGKANKARQNSKRRAAASLDTLTADEWQLILAAQNYCCGRCHSPFGPALEPTRDHMMPLARGGALTLENTQALCRSCNSSKNASHEVYRLPIIRLEVQSYAASYSY